MGDGLWGVMSYEYFSYCYTLAMNGIHIFFSETVQFSKMMVWGTCHHSHSHPDNSQSVRVLL